MFDFADVTENGILRWNIQFSFCDFCPVHWRLLFKSYIEKKKIVLIRESRNTNGIICTIKPSIKRRSENAFFVFYFDLKYKDAIVESGNQRLSTEE